MEAAEKNFNKRAKVGYSDLMTRVMKDELRRNNTLENANQAKAILSDLKSLDSLASGNYFTGNVSGKDFAKLIHAAGQSYQALLNYHNGLQTSSDDYRKAVAQIRDAVNQLSQTTAAVATMVNQSDRDKKGRMRAAIVKKTQIDSAFDACKDRMEALSKDIGRFLAANNEKEITKHMEKLKKMKNEYELLAKEYGDANEMMRSCINN